ncbi:hypothetical protein [Streptomyces sp. NPDC060031]|uniref:hypothetical protein n=1 Tax=Streptomyces sp. NPDC060031 TaxID=3347043 RepID=UPI0036772B8C
MSAELLTVVTLTPFVSAVAAVLGTKVGEGIDAALGRVLQKVPRMAILLSRSPGVDAPAELPTTPSAVTLSYQQGPKIHITSTTPSEALTILPTMDYSGLTDLRGRFQIVRWIEGRWHALTIEGEEVVDLVWDVEARLWAPYADSTA